MMKRGSILFLQSIILLTGIAVLFFMIRLPLTEGRAKELDLFHIYADPFILYGYASSIAFFIGLYKLFRLLGYIGQNKLYSAVSAGAIKSIKYCAIVLSVLIVAAGIFILTSHHKEDDPAGFLALCMVTALISVVVAVVAGKFENKINKFCRITPASYSGGKKQMHQDQPHEKL